MRQSYRPIWSYQSCFSAETIYVHLGWSLSNPFKMTRVQFFCLIYRKKNNGIKSGEFKGKEKGMHTCTHTHIFLTLKGNIICGKKSHSKWQSK